MTQLRKLHPPRSPRQAAARPGPLDAALDPDLFKALADPTRARLIACIAKCARGCSVGEVADCCSVDLSVVSRHLALLARAGVLGVIKDGRVVRYHVRYPDLCRSLRSLADALDRCAPPSGSCCEGGCCDAV